VALEKEEEGEEETEITENQDDTSLFGLYFF